MSAEAREVDRTCRRYCLRPSEFIGLTDPLLAYDFDMAMAIVHAKEQDSRLAEVAKHNALAHVFLAMR